MTLKSEAEKKIRELFGEEIANQINNFENPKLYPCDFLDECVYFVGQLLGHDRANKKFALLYKKYCKRKKSS